MKNARAKTRSAFREPAIMSGGLAQNRLSAKCATARVNRNFAEALRAFLCGRIGRCRFFLHPRDEPINRYHDEEIDGGRDQHKRNDRIDEIADRKRGTAHGEFQAGVIWLAYDQRDQWRQKSFRKFCDYPTESR